MSSVVAALLAVYSLDGFSPYSLVGALCSLLAYSLMVPPTVPLPGPNAIFLSRLISSVLAPPDDRCIALWPGAMPPFRSSADSSPSRYRTI
jgi:hypothetical protein